MFVLDFVRLFFCISLNLSDFKIKKNKKKKKRQAKQKRNGLQAKPEQTG